MKRSAVSRSGRLLDLDVVAELREAVDEPAGEPVVFVVLFCQPPDSDQAVAAAASTGCERRIAHLLRFAHHC
jgi:hypothetical protein